MSNEWLTSVDGLPPVGLECECAPVNTQWGFSDCNYRKCKVIVYYGDYVWLDTFVTGIPVATRIDKVIFRPIKSDREKAIEAATKSLSNLRLWQCSKEDLECLYDAGLLRLPEDK